MGNLRKYWIKVKKLNMSLDLNSSAEQVNCSFVSEKVSKIRFVQEKYKQADTFITGGWGSDPNAIGLWKLTKDEQSNDENEVDYSPKSISKIKVDGDVTGLEFLNSESIVCTTSSENGKYKKNQFPSVTNFIFFYYNIVGSILHSSITFDQFKSWFNT